MSSSTTLTVLFGICRSEKNRKPRNPSAMCARLAGQTIYNSLLASPDRLLARPGAANAVHCDLQWLFGANGKRYY
jgi:hypothetical protein